MKPITFIIAFIAITYIAIAQDTTQTVGTMAGTPKPPKPNSKVGIMAGLQWFYLDNKIIHTAGRLWDQQSWGTPVGIGVSVFYHHSYDHNLFFQISLDYNTYKTQTEEYYTWTMASGWGLETATHKQPDEYFATIGVGWWCYSDKIYVGMATGLMAEHFVYLLAGATYPIPKYNISIEAKARLGLSNSGINIGLAYLLP